MEYFIMDANLLNGLSLAYIGDAIFEVYIREYALSLGLTHVNDLHKKVINYTSGASQAFVIHHMMENNMLTEEEYSIFKRGRNSHVKTSRKNLDLKDYLDATGFEALVGYLYLEKKLDRLKEIVDLSISLRS